LAEKIISNNQKFDLLHIHNWMSWLTAKELMKHDNNLNSVVTFHFLQKQYELMKENPISSIHNEIVDIEQEAIANSKKIIVLSESQKEDTVQKVAVENGRLGLYDALKLT